MRECGNRTPYADQDRRCAKGPHGYLNGSTLKGNIDEATQLMRRVTNGDIDAFDRLYNEFSPILKRLFANCDHRHMSLDDFVQEVFTRLWQQRRNYRGTSCFLTYLLGIARYTLNEKLRQSYRLNRIRVGNMEELAPFILDSPNSLSQPEAKFYLKELMDALKVVKGKLTEKQRQVLELSQATETSLHEASQKLGCSPGALRCRLKRARKRSRELLAQIFDSQ